MRIFGLVRQVVLWAAVPLVVILLLSQAGHPAATTGRYVGTWCVLVLLPGTLLWRTLTGGRSWAQDLGFGSVLGLAWALGVWAVFTGVGYPRQQWMATVGLILALIPLVRRRSPERISWLPVMVLGLVLAAVRVYVELLRLVPLPPTAFGRHQDVWFQLGLVQALERHVVPPDLTAAGEPLIYHWFTNGLMAAHAQVSGVGAPEVLLHQWPMTMALTFVLVGWAAGELLSGVRWAGPVAGLVSGVFSGGLRLTDEPGVDMAGALSIQGPTGTLAAVVMLGLVGPTVLILRRQAGKGTWIAMVMLLVLACGTKPTLLPIMGVGCAVAAIACWLVERRFPLRVVVLGLLCGGLFLAATSTLTGSTGGSRVQFLAALKVLPYYGVVTGDRSFPTYGGLVVPGIADDGLWFFAAVLVAWYCVLSLPRLLAVVGIVLHPTRRDPACWWAAACVVTGAAITLVFSHTGYSEYHFLRTVIHLGPVVVVASVARVLGEEVRHRRVRVPLAVSLAGGIGTAVLLRQLWPTVVVTDQREAAVDLLGPAALLVVVGGLVVLAIRRVVAPRHWPRALVVYATCFIAASSLPAQTTYLAVASYGAVVDRSFSTGQGTRVYLTRAEQEAMLWLHEHAGPDDVAVSNVFCMPTRYRPGCPNDAYWVAGLSGVQQYLSGWAYAPQNLAATEHTRSYLSLPPPWPDRLADSLAAVQRPTPELLARLRDQQGVDWIIADRRAGPVSPKLGVPAYENEDVKIFRLQ